VVIGRLLLPAYFRLGLYFLEVEVAVLVDGTPVYWRRDVARWPAPIQVFSFLEEGFDRCTV